MAVKKFGYARVSTKDQNLARQIEILKAEGIEERDIFVEKESGRYDFCYDCDGETVNYGGIHCGEVFEFCLNDVWVPARVEMYEDWYLVGLPGLKMEGLEVRTR